MTQFDFSENIHNLLKQLDTCDLLCSCSNLQEIWMLQGQGQNWERMARLTWSVSLKTATMWVTTKNFRSTYKHLVVGSWWLHTWGFGSHMHKCTQHAQHIHICTFNMHTCTLHMHTCTHTHIHNNIHIYTCMHIYILRNLRDCTVHSQNPETARQFWLWLCNLKFNCTLWLRNLVRVVLLSKAPCCWSVDQ